MNQERSILVYESLSENEKFSFSSPVVQKLQEKYPTIPLFHIDSKSDSFLFSQAEKMLTDTPPTLFIVINDKKGNHPSNLAPLLMKARGQNEVNIVSLYTNQLVEKIKGVMIYESEEKLLNSIYATLDQPDY